MKRENLVLLGSLFLAGLVGMNALADTIYPGADAEETTAAIQAALDAEAAKSTPGTVTLGQGTFLVNTQLVLSAGVTLEGQGWKKTVLQQTETGANRRVVLITDGSVLRGVTLTGGHTRGSSASGYVQGAGAKVENGTISWCCVTGNMSGDPSWAGATVNNANGTGIFIRKGRIDHTIVSLNSAYCNGGGSNNGGGIGVYNATGPVTIESCLVYGNRVQGVNTQPGSGAGIYILGGADGNTQIINTTVVDNVADGKGGGLCCDNSCPVLTNCIFADNMSGDGDGNLSLSSKGVSASSYGCLFANETTPVGVDSIGGNPKFVDAEHNDYHLSADSDAFGIGFRAETDQSLDLDGNDWRNPPSAGCYECVAEDPGIVRVGSVTVTAETTSAVVSGKIATLGQGSSATVTIRWGVDSSQLSGTQSDSGLTEDFSFALTGLDELTKYCYELTVENDVGRSVTKTGSFRTLFDVTKQLLPVGDPEVDTVNLKEAISSVAASGGTLQLGEGLFLTSEQLVLENGITVAGQGWEKTVIRQTSAGDNQRVVLIRGGSTIRGVTLTGGHTRGSSQAGYVQGAGAKVDDGYVSWCCVSNNISGDPSWAGVNVNNGNGTGISILKGGIDHTIVCFNTAYCNGGGNNHGGGIGIVNPSSPVTIDTCLVYSNNVQGVGTSADNKGAGIFVLSYSGATVARIVNTTVVGNVADGAGAGLYAQNAKPVLVNCIFAENRSGIDGETNPNVAFGSADRLADSDNVSSNCIFGTVSEKLGTDSLVADPLFKNVNKCDFRLTSKSPAIDHALASVVASVDLAGHMRDKRPDIGCYEFTSHGFIIRVR